jgi:hypothetical protein
MGWWYGASGRALRRVWATYHNPMKDSQTSIYAKKRKVYRRKICTLYTPCPVCGKDKWLVTIPQTATTTGRFECVACRKEIGFVRGVPSFTQDYLLGYNRGRLDAETKYRKEVKAGATRTLTVTYAVSDAKLSNPRFPKGQGL